MKMSKSKTMAGSSEKKKRRSGSSSPKEQSNSLPKKIKTEFTDVKFKFHLRSQDTIVSALQTFLEHCSSKTDVESEAGEDQFSILKSYCQSSPLCSEVLELLDRPTKTSREIHYVFKWLRFVLKACKGVVLTYSTLRQHVVSILLTKHMHVILNSLRQGNKPSHVKSTLLLLGDIVDLGYKYARLVHVHFDFNHHNLPHLLSQRDRRDPCDVRSSMILFLMKLLLVGDVEMTRSLVDQKALLQEVLKGLSYDRSDLIKLVLSTVHDMIVLNESVGKTQMMHLFNTPVLKELLQLYHWPGPKMWMSKPTPKELREYTDEQHEVAEAIHPLLVDLCATTKPGICFFDKTFGMSAGNKNPTLSKVLESLLTSYTTPLSYKLVLVILKTCPDQVKLFLKQLQPHLVPRPVDTWLACIHLFKQIIQAHDWPPSMDESQTENLSDEKVSHLVHFLFPPENIISSFKDGLSNSCPVVRHECLQLLELVARKGLLFKNISVNKFGDKNLLTRAIEGFILKIIPSPTSLLSLLQSLSYKESFSSPGVTKDLYKDTSFQLPVVSRFQHLVAILKIYGLAPQHLTNGPSEAAPLLLSIVAEVRKSKLDIDLPPSGTPVTIPSLCLLHVFSCCDVRKLSLFGDSGNKEDNHNSLLHQLISLTQIHDEDAIYRDMAQVMIVKLLLSTGLFEGHQGELVIWLRHLQDSIQAPSSVVTFFISTLRQYITNPYPANDRLLELFEDVSESSYIPGFRLEFSPLSMLALKNDFYTVPKVHRYLCCVLVDILHSLPVPYGFSRIVHLLSQHLNPNVAHYITLHDTSELASLESIMSRTRSKPRLKQAKGPFKFHQGLKLMKSLMKEKKEDLVKRIETLVFEFSPSCCLALIQQCLQYLDEMTAGVDEVMEVLKNKKIVLLCLELLKVTLHFLSQNKTCTSKIKSGSKIKEPKHTSLDSRETVCLQNDVTEVVAKDLDENHHEIKHIYCVALHRTYDEDKLFLDSLQDLATDWFQEAVLVLLHHRLVRHWLFKEGFSEHAQSSRVLTVKLCGIVVDCLSVRKIDWESKLLKDIIHEYCQQIQSLLKCYLEMSPSLQSVLGKCVETFFSALGQSGKVSALFAVLSLPLDCFLPKGKEKGPLNPGKVKKLPYKVLREITIGLAAGMKLGGCLPSDLLQNENFSVDTVSRLLDLLSILDNSHVDSFALNLIQVSPNLALACSERTWTAMLDHFSGMTPVQQELVETLMTINPQCRLQCGKWLGKYRTKLRKNLPEFSALMLLYVRIMQQIGSPLIEDKGIGIVREVIVLSVKDYLSSIPEICLHILCHLIHSQTMELHFLQEVKKSILELAHREILLNEWHFQVLAAIIRHEKVLDEVESVHVSECWNSSKSQMLVACLQYLTSKPLMMVSDWSENKDTVECVVEFCHILLPGIQAVEKAAIITFWPELVKSCLKQQYKNAKVMSLLRKLVVDLFTEEDNDLDMMEKTPIRDQTGDQEDTGDISDKEKGEEFKNDNQDVSDKSTITAGEKRQAAEKLKITATTKMKSEISEVCCLKCYKERNMKLGRSSEEFEDDTAQNTFLTRSYFFQWEKHTADYTSTSDSRRRLSSTEYVPVVLDLFQKCITHSEFLMVMRGGELKSVKDELVWLLVLLAFLEKQCCLTLSQNILVAAYGASLSLTDQRLLLLLFFCEKYGSSGKIFNPTLWGDAAVNLLEVQKHMGPSLMRATQLKQVLEHIDQGTMEKSILQFPLRRSLNVQHTEDAKRLLSHYDCYDPGYFLPLFCRFLGPEHIVDVRAFVNTNCLGFVLAALSSHDSAMRSAAYMVLANFYSHVEGTQRLPEKSQLLAFLDLIRNSMTKENQKLACIITLFLARASRVIFDLGHKMYCAISSFLLLKPALDLNHVPEFYNFFNSSSLHERCWLMQLLHDGLRETGDYRIFEKRHVFKLLMSHISSSLGDIQSNRLALLVLVQATSLATVVQALVVDNGFLPWLISFIRNSLVDTMEHTIPVCQIVHHLWTTTTFNSARMWWRSISHIACESLYSSLLVCVHLLLSNFSKLHSQSVNLLLEVLQNPRQPEVSEVTSLACKSMIELALCHLGQTSTSNEQQ